MKATCPENPEHKRFITPATVREDWIVDERGEFQEVSEDGESTVVDKPSPGNHWGCVDCAKEGIETAAIVVAD